VKGDGHKAQGPFAILTNTQPKHSKKIELYEPIVKISLTIITSWIANAKSKEGVSPENQA
jgi:hypothetical protein